MQKQTMQKQHPHQTSITCQASTCLPLTGCLSSRGTCHCSDSSATAVFFLCCTRPTVMRAIRGSTSKLAGRLYCCCCCAARKQHLQHATRTRAKAPATAQEHKRVSSPGPGNLLVRGHIGCMLTAVTCQSGSGRPVPSLQVNSCRLTHHTLMTPTETTHCMRARTCSNGAAAGRGLSVSAMKEPSTGPCFVPLSAARQHLSEVRSPAAAASGACGSGG